LNKRIVGLAVIAAVVAVGAASYKTIYEDRFIAWLASADSNAAPNVPVKAPDDNPRQRLLAQIEAEAKAPVEPSPWIEAEKRRYAALLASSRADVLVLPFQVPAGAKQFGVDATSRMVMAHMTAQRLAGGELKVADVAHVAKALARPRRMTRDQAAQFGSTVRAQTVIFGEASHDGGGHLTLTLSAIPAGAAGQTKSVSRSGIEIADAVPPELAYEKVADALMRELGIAGVHVAALLIRERS
jgi:hypothetical protein